MLGNVPILADACFRGPVNWKLSWATLLMLTAVYKLLYFLN